MSQQSRVRRISRIKAFFIISVGFVLDAYDLFLINIIMVILGDLYDRSDLQEALLASSTLVGAMLGQLIFGLLSKRISESVAFMTTIALIVVGMAGIVASVDSDALSIYWLLIAFRFILGLGIGGEYPLSASLVREIFDPRTAAAAAPVGTADPEDDALASVSLLAPSSTASLAEVDGKRATRISSNKPVMALFSMQGVGNFLAPLVVLGLLFASNDLSTEILWRLAFGLGLIPALALIPLRWYLHLSLHVHGRPLADGLVSQKEGIRPATAAGATHSSSVSLSGSNVSFSSADLAVGPYSHVPSPQAAPADATMAAPLTDAAADGAEKNSRRHQCSHTRSLLNLVGCAVSWFLFDVSFYGNALFSSSVLNIVFDTGDADHPSHSDLISIAVASLCLSAIALPGYWMATAFVDRIGSIRLQTAGFAMTGLIFGVMGFFYSALQANPAAFIVLYGLSFFFGNFGPNSTTFVLPTQLFDADVRTSYHGYAASAGKAGAIAGSFVFGFFIHVFGIETTLYSCAAVSVLGLLSTVAFIRGGR